MRSAMPLRALAFALVLGVGRAAADEPPADARAEQAGELLAAGRPQQAILVYRSILDADPGRLDARDGLVRALLAAGDPEAAAREADERLARRPEDEDWRRRRLYVLGLAPSRRAEAVAGYQELVAARPDDAEAFANLGLFLSWTPGRLPEAVEAWRRAVAIDPTPGARLGLARTLAWSGANAEAAATFDALLAEDPRDVEALLGRSQLARWTGDRRTARALLERAEALAPDDPRLRAERARLELDAGRHGVARGAAQAAVEASPGLYEGREALAAFRDATAPRVAVRVTGTEESTAFRRLGVALPVDLHPLPDTGLRLEPAFTRFGEATMGDPASGEPSSSEPAELDRVSVGAEVRQTGLPQGLYGRGAYRLHALLGAGATHEVDLELGAERPLDLPVDLRVGARQRALVDAPADDEVFAPLDAVGSGGATFDGLHDGLEVREGYAGLATAPLPGLYVYGDGAVGEVDGDNARRTVSAGLGQDVLRVLRTRSAHALTVRYDLYYLSVAAPDPRYFSPDAYLTHTPGVEWRWSPGRATVGLEAGVPLRADAPAGWLAGGFAGLELGEHLDVAARVRTVDDTAWRATGATVAATGSW